MMVGVDEDPKSKRKALLLPLGQKVKVLCVSVPTSQLLSTVPTWTSLSPLPFLTLEVKVYGKECSKLQSQMQRWY